MKELMALLNLHFANVCSDESLAAANGGPPKYKCNLYFDTFAFTAAVPKANLVINGEGSTRCPLWGRVVTEVQAKSVNKNALAFLGDSDNQGPALYLDGSAYQQFTSSSCCLGWCIPPLPKAYHKPQTQVGEEENEEQPQSPPCKKPKKISRSKFFRQPMS